MRIDPATDALIIVDLQPDFMPGGPLAVAEGHSIAEPIARLARRFSTVVATQDWHPRGHVSFASTHGRAPFSRLPIHGSEHVLWPEHCLAGSAGAQLHAALPDELVTLILRKGTRQEVDSYSGFRENVGPDGQRPPTGLAGWLRERVVRRLFVCGLARDFCVRATALDGVEAGFAVHVIDDLTRAVDPTSRSAVDVEFARRGVQRVESAQLVASAPGRPPALPAAGGG